MLSTDSPEVVVIGGSYAGLAAALTLGRALRRVLVLDAGQPCNRWAAHSHNFLTRDGAPPADLAAIARAELRPYTTVQLRDDTAVAATPVAGGFAVHTALGATFTARKLLLATGIVDELPDLPGLAACWGRSVLHCPYCHGYEVHGQPLGVLANGDAGFEFGRLIRQWSPDVRLLTNGPSTLSAEQTAGLAAQGIGIVEIPLQALVHAEGHLQHVAFSDGSALPLTAVFARVPFRQSSDLAARLGCALTETGLLEVDFFGRTSVPDVYAAGDNSSPMRQLMAAAANGSRTGAFINHDLITAGH